LNHEIAHGLYYLNDDYKFEIDTFLAEINKKDILKMKKIIEAENIYSENKIMDELQAHLVNNYYYFLGRNKADEKGIDEEKIKKYSLKINKLFEKYSKNIKGIQPFEL